MANVQPQIETFDETIRLKNLVENDELRKKRDIILDKLRDRFDADRTNGKPRPTFSPFNQGSYAMGTGIKPADADYDIDVGLRFNTAKSDYPNPVDLKALVAEALEGHTELGTDVRRSCVTVRYKKDGEQAFHVDLAVYAYDDPKSEVKKLFISKGKLGSDVSNRFWEESDPLGLIEVVDGRFTDKDEESQFLRTIRLLKRWKSEKFKTDGNNAPSGIGITIAAIEHFKPSINRDPIARTARPRDQIAMRDFVGAMIQNFTVVSTKSDGTPLYRLTVKLPVAPKNDIFARMTDGQMSTFRDRLIALRDALDKAHHEPDPVEACKILRGEFGDEFPVPEKSSTGSGGRKAVTSSGVAA